MALTLCEETTLGLWRSVIKIDSSDLKLWGLETALLDLFFFAREESALRDNKRICQLLSTLIYFGLEMTRKGQSRSIPPIK